MSRLISAGTGGNFTTAATWQVADTTAAWTIDSEASTLTISTSTSTHISPSATPGAITIDGVALKISSLNVNLSGTFTVVLRNTTAGSDVTSVVVNVADLPLNGWCFFKFSGSQVLLAATNYAIRVTCSVASQVILFRSTASAQEFTRLIRTTTTAAPGAGDQIIIGNELTGIGANNGISVTMDNTASTIFGATTYTDSIALGNNAQLSYQRNASTNYILKVAGLITVHYSGVFYIGIDPSNRIPSTSTAKILFSVATNVDSGLVVKAGGTFATYGNVVTADNTLLTASIGGYVTTVGTAVTKVSGQSFTGLTGTIRINGVNYTISSVTDSSHLTLTSTAGTQANPVVFTHAGTANVLTVASTSGWAANDVIAIASTSRTAADSESATIQSVDSSTQVTLTTALTNQHSGDTPTQAEIVHLTRNVTISGTSTSLQGYINCAADATVTMSYAECYWLGSATANKRGIDVATITGTCTLIGCTLHDFTVASSRAINVAGATSNNISITYCHMYNNISADITTVATSGTNYTFDHIISMKSGSTAFSLADVGGTITNITVVSAASSGISITETNTIGTMSGITVHSNASTGITISNIISGTISSITSWRNTGVGLTIAGFINGVTVFDTMTLFGNTTNNIGLGTSSETIFKTVTASSDIIFSTTTGINYSSAGGVVYFINSTFGVVSGIKTAHTNDVTLGNGSPIPGKMIFKNCSMASATEVVSQTAMMFGTQILSQDHDQTAGTHKRWERTGTASTDTVTYKTASPAETLTPNNATDKFASSPTQPIAVASGATATITVYVNKSASYNGNQPRLMLRAGTAWAITADSVLATASGGTGSWLTLSGTTPTAAFDGGAICYVDCDGTAGTVTVDDWSVL